MSSGDSTIGELFEVRQKTAPLQDGEPTFVHVAWFRDGKIATSIANTLPYGHQSRRVDAFHHRPGHAIVDGERVGVLREVAYFDDAVSFWRSSGLAKLREEERAALGIDGGTTSSFRDALAVGLTMAEAISVLEEQGCSDAADALRRWGHEVARRLAQQRSAQAAVGIGGADVG
jgi:hypothetical protein